MTPSLNADSNEAAPKVDFIPASLVRDNLIRRILYHWLLKHMLMETFYRYTVTAC